MASHRIFNTDSENTSLLINNPNISLIFSPDIVTFAMIYRFNNFVQYSVTDGVC